MTFQVKIVIIYEKNHKSATKWQKKNIGMEFVNIQTEEFNPRFNK